MTRIATALATILSLAFTPLVAQEIVVTPLPKQDIVVAPAFPPECYGWISSDWGVAGQTWEPATVDTVSECLNAGADVNARNEYGRTPLHYAARFSENPEVITALLDAGADGTAVNKDGKTPFDLAKDNEALAGTDAYWALNDARFK